MKRKLYLLNSFVAALVFSGCAGYRLGGTHPEGIETVTMAPVINKSTEPAIELQVTHAMRERIQFDGRLQLVNEPKNADAIMEITLTSYQLSAIAFHNDSKTTAKIYRLKISGEAKLKSTKTGKEISRSSTYGESTFEFDSDLTGSKRDALPYAAKEIAKFMFDDLVEQW